MTALADAERTVRRARRRIVASAALDGGAFGAAAAAAAGVVVAWIAGPPASDVRAAALVALPLAGALTGAAAVAWRRAPGLDGAALALDRAARTDEAFVSALAARDASPEFRALSAAWALRRCPFDAVAAALPLAVPRMAAAAALSAAALAAVVLVPRAAEGFAPTPASGDTQGVAGGSPPRPGPRADPAAPAVSPRERVADLAAALRAGDAPAAERLRGPAQGDLAAAPVADLRSLADALAATGSAAAQRAADALARGDVASGIAALLEALGGRPAGAGTGSGGSEAGVPGAGSGPPVLPRSTGAWPLRYDRQVRRWLEETR